MFRHLFRGVLAIGILVWIVFLWQFIDLRIKHSRAADAAAQALLPRATSTALPVPTFVAPTLQPLPNTVADGQGGSELPASANDVRGVHPKTGRYVAAWLPTSFDAEAARATFEANKDILDEVSPFWYGVRPDGTLIADVGSRDAELVQIAKENNVLIIPTVHNIEDLEAASVVLATPESRTNHINIIMDEVRTYGYDGIDIDYESLALDYEDEFTAFMTELGAALHAEDKLLTVAVHAHTGRPDYQNYADLGKVVDRLRIMTYDYSWRGSEPGPIAPMFWVKAVAEYAKTQVDPSKIQIGISFYAYDWPGNGGFGVARTYTEVEEIKATYQPQIRLVEEDGGQQIQESTFNYAGRTVWFSNYRSLTAKMEMVRENDLAGIAIWRLGSEDPQNWTYIRESLKQDPLIVQRSINRYLPGH
ncbi:MAG TPA: glycoside hydrolase [Herpetosiphon sp.]|uniref:Glycoside hydrolase family 18 n=1 Tax=Herpetosiphon aurantiacus (strain ATCC 23779 / DSM 785 / 114-95) TaxID=316274 RepID=A9B0U5_HERA2|nr:glycosyl hydrolase family 18 protein [Herpetosiphon sp.]ABX03815.1 glycoside hydrolase family 18 [Herpetosiphon aurantiacus DSM 785]HBW49005.1 glycoside hydrolase [Herpetosiphon sp.]